MKYFISVTCITAAVQCAMHAEDTIDITDFKNAIMALEHSATTDAENAMDLEDIEDIIAFSMQLDNSGTCSMCGTKTVGTENAAGDIWKDNDAYYDGGRCLHCGYNTIHLGCALSSLYPIKCYSCGKDICCRFYELDRFIEELQTGCAESTDIENFIYALNRLESMPRSLIVSTLYSYDMTVDEVNSLRKFVGRMGDRCNMSTQYPNIIDTVDSIIRIKTVFRARTEIIFNFLADARAFAIALPLLRIMITPYFISKADEKQIMKLIKSFASYRGVYTSLSKILIRKTVDLVDIEKFKSFSNDSIKNLLCDLIDSDSCAAIKYLVGRRQFSHQLTIEEACAIIVQYSHKGAYKDEAFMPLLIFLINGYINAGRSQSRIITRVSDLLWQISNAANPMLYAKLKTICKKCKPGAINMMAAMTNYAFDDGDFTLSEDIFCAIIGAQKTIKEIVSLIINSSCAGCAHIFRHLPFAWMLNDDNLSILKQTVARGNFAVLEEMIIIYCNRYHPTENVHDFLKILLNSNCRDYAGLLIRKINYHMSYSLKNKERIYELIKLLESIEMYWCLSYLRYKSKKEAFYKLLNLDHQKIIDDAVFRKFQFPELFCEIIRYDFKNDHFIENLSDYIIALLNAGANRYAVQRFFIETSSLCAFSQMVKDAKLLTIYNSFIMHQDRFFYLDAFYQTLRYATWKNSLKIIILDHLEKLTSKKNWWATTSVGDGALRKKRNCEKCSGLGYWDYSCNHCVFVNKIPFEDLLAVLRYALANQ